MDTYINNNLQSSDKNKELLTAYKLTLETKMIKKISLLFVFICFVCTSIFAKSAAETEENIKLGISGYKHEVIEALGGKDAYYRLPVIATRPQYTLDPVMTQPIMRTKDDNWIFFKWLDGETKQVNLGYLYKDFEKDYWHAVACDSEEYFDAFFLMATKKYKESLRKLTLNKQTFIDTTGDGIAMQLAESYSEMIKISKSPGWTPDFHEQLACLAKLAKGEEAVLTGARLDNGEPVSISMLPFEDNDEL